jgi:diaminopimelate epimerase
MKQIPFIKMHGLGNDFVIFDLRNSPALPSLNYQLIANRKIGIGCDQVIILTPCENADCEMLIYNTDGSRADACGNATRCVSNLMGATQNIIKVGNRLLMCRNLSDQQVQVNMGHPTEADPKQIFISAKACHYLDVGNPHLIIVGNPMTEEIAQHAQQLYPAGINVNFARITDRTNIDLKTWERGVGPTSACGTGACATAYTLYKLGLCDALVDVNMQGGKLSIQIRDNDIWMTGPAETSFTGHWPTF